MRTNDKGGNDRGGKKSLILLLTLFSF
jgi:hypothetical protein